MMQLQQLHIECCAGLEHIVAGEEGTDTSISFVFPKVVNLKFWDLPKLKGFYPSSEEQSLLCLIFEESVKGGGGLFQLPFSSLHNSSVQHKIEAAENNGERIEGDVLDWLQQVDEMVPKADDLSNDERHANTACSGRSIPNPLLRHKLSIRSKKMKEEIVKIKEKGSFDSVSYRGPNLIRASSLTTHGEKFGIG
ncbi:hypothetical protein L6164_000970 [Bauhinia variegata]|uniref:Uncharacterized protein n=1 Tax=Bauhinia variegata TaxID=167791 RepID=A0ACB9Q844_BAUVA|nr:hypothetical protein L6164_000970 [Bauhinia variegata]